MVATFSRFSSLGKKHFRAALFGERIALLHEELAGPRDLIQGQCLSAVAAMTVIAYLLVRGIDSLWAIALIVPLIAMITASLQHAMALYRCYVHAYVMPSLCDAFGRLRHTIGEAPDLCTERLVEAGLLPPHGRYLVDDAFFGDYRGCRFTLALVNLWRGDGGDPPTIDRENLCYQAIVVIIRWPTRPARLPSDELSDVTDGHHRISLAWSEGFLLLTLPCLANPFDLGGLFQPPTSFLQRLHLVAGVLQMPANFIDYMLDATADRRAVRATEIRPL